MTIYEWKSKEIIEINETSFANEGIKERADLQRLLIDKINVISSDLYVITEEFGEWVDSNRRIDILAIDKDANLVVIELKRTQDGGHMELQAIRYAAMISTLTFDQIVDIHAKYLEKRNSEENARDKILTFLEWEEPDEERFANDVRIVLVSAEFSKEITTSVMWLNSRDLDITCIRMKPYKLDDKILLDVQQIIPLPEAEEYQIKVKEKDQKQRSKKWVQKPITEVWEEMRVNWSEDEYKRAENIKDWLELNGNVIFPTSDGFASYLKYNNQDQFFFKITVNGDVQIWFQYLANKPPFSDEPLRLELLRRLNNIDGVAIDSSKIKGKPKFPIKLLLSEKSYVSFIEAFEWAFSVIKSGKHHNDI